MEDERLLEKGSTFLDSTAQRALNVFPGKGDKSKKTSLYGLLDINHTAMGSRLLEEWMKDPLQDLSKIHERHEIVDEFVRSRQLCESLREEQLKPIPDINKICGYFTSKKATLDNMVRLYECSVRIPYIVKLFKDASQLGVSKFAKPLAEYSKELENFEKLVETTIDLDQMHRGEYVINPKVNPALVTLREELEDIEAKMNREHRSVCSATGLNDGRSLKDGVKLEDNDKYGFVFRVTRKNEKTISGSKYITLDTRKDGVRFQTRTLRDLSHDHADIMKQYKASSGDMLKKTIGVASGYVEVFQDVAAVLAEIDVLASFATTVSQGRGAYCRPKMLPAGQGLVLKSARHPIVEENMDSADAYIANDIDLRRSPQESTGGALLIVTGPNMGGKSTFIRTAGVAVVLAHIGAFVPAEEASVPLTDRILCRIGAWDNHHRQESTFMAEMLETSAILKAATKDSLIIIDELGRGTGTTDGYGLADGICTHIVSELQASCLFATHFYELTQLADKYHDAIRNLHVTASVDPAKKKSLTFLYEALPGVCDRSFGVNVAEMAHFPSSVVDLARVKTEELEKEGKNNTGAGSNNNTPAAAPDEPVDATISDAISQLHSLAQDASLDRSEALAKARELRQKLIAMNVV